MATFILVKYQVFCFATIYVFRKKNTKTIREKVKIIPPPFWNKTIGYKEDVQNIYIYAYGHYILVR